jgi:hypothetical protein
MIDFSKTAATSKASGFKNYTTTSFSVAAGGYNLAAGGYQTHTATATLSRENSVSQIQIKYDGLDSFSQLVRGKIIQRYPTWAGATYEVGSYTYFTGTTLTVFTYVVNQTAGLVAIPSFTVECNASLFIAPFVLQ